MTVSKQLIENVGYLKKAIGEISVYNLDVYTAIELYYMIARKLNEVIKELMRFEFDIAEEVVKQNEKLLYLLGEGLTIEVVKKIDEMVKDGTFDTIINHNIFKGLNDKIDNIEIDLNSKINKNKQNNGTRTPQDFGAIGDGIEDDSLKILEAMNYCAENNFILMFNKKYRIATNIKYLGSRSLNIIGTCGNYPSLLHDDVPMSSEVCNIFFDNATLELNKMGSVTFNCVGFASTSREFGKGIILNSFHNKFINCSFSQMNKAIQTTTNFTNWIGENQVLYSNFYKCEYCFYSMGGSDSEFIGNLIHGSCGVGFYGECAGFTFSNNHFYNKKPSVFKFFNTKISNNYIQEMTTDDPSIILEGSFGCMINSNNFELNNSDPRPNKKGLIGLSLRSGGGNITIDSNSVHGKNISPVENLSFIKLIYTTTKFDMPITLGTNNLRCCKSIFNEDYPMYNIKGCLNVTNLNLTPLGGVIESQKSEVINGICYFHVIMSSVPNYADFLRVKNTQDIPFQYTLKQTLNDDTINHVTYISKGNTIYQSNYSQVKKVEICGSYMISRSTEKEYIL